MAKVDQKPSPEEQERRRKPPTIVKIKDVTTNNETRLRTWALEVMKKNEFRLNKKTRNKKIVWSGVVEPEDIDIKAIYPFEDLNWVIFRDGAYWTLMLRSKEKALSYFTYATLDSI